MRAHQAGQTTLVVSPAIEERSELNRVIRELLVKHDVVACEGVELRTLSSLNLTRAQRAHARHYDAGDVIRFRRGSAKLGITPGEYLTVEASDTKRNLLRLRTENGASIEHGPRPVARRVSLPCEISHDRGGRSHPVPLQIVHWASPTVNSRPQSQSTAVKFGCEPTGAKKSSLRTPGSATSTMATPRPRTPARARPSIASSSTLIPSAARLVNRRQFYVSLSRARLDARIYTGNAEALARAVGREQLKATPSKISRKPSGNHCPGSSRSTSKTRSPPVSSRASGRSERLSVARESVSDGKGGRGK